MKKNIKIIIFTFIIYFGMIINAQATYSVVFEQSYILEGPSKTFHSQYIVDGDANVHSYCMAPGKTGHTSYEKDGNFDPTSSMYHLALAVAYTKLVERNLLNAGGYESAVFRLVSSYYSKLDTGGEHPQNAEPYELVNNSTSAKNTKYWRRKEGKKAFDVFTSTISAVSSASGKNAKKKYESLSKSLFFKDENVKFTAKDIKITKNTGTNKNKVDVTFTVEVNDSSVTPNWGSFTKGTHVNSIQTNNKKGTFKVRINKNVTSFSLNGSYSTRKNISTKSGNTEVYRLAILKPSWSADAYQKMILVDSTPVTYNKTVTVDISSTPDGDGHSPCTIEGTTYYGSSATVVSATDYRSQCVKQCKVEGTTYYCKNTNPDVNGRVCTYPEYRSECNPIKCAYETNPVDKSTVYFGPDGKQTTQENYQKNCVKQCKVEGTTYYCKSTNPDVNGRVCTYPEYRSECNPIKCQFEPNPTTGARVYFGADGKQVTQEQFRQTCVKRCKIEGTTYYCEGDKNDLDKNGPTCTENEYYKQCTYCGQNESICNTNPHDPRCPADYFLDCPKCIASVSVPSTCSDFNESPKIEGTISDLNKVETSCSPSVNAVKGCVLGGKDIAGNTFQIEALKNNRYCKIYCYEEYSFALPTARHSTSGGYFNLQMSVTGTRHCYLASNNMIGKGKDKSKQQFDTVTFQNDLQALLNKINGLNRNDASLKQEFVNLTNSIEQLANEFSQCTSLNGWNNDMNFNPTISYEYNNYTTYPNNYSSGTFGKISETSEIKNTYCYSSTDGHYNCTGYSTEVPDPNNLKKYTYYGCTKNSNGTYNCYDRQLSINMPVGIEKTVTKTATYAPSRSFNSYHQYGTVKTGDLCSGTGFNNCLWTRLPETALPIELKTGKGAFPYKIKISNIGQYNDKNSLGRLVGNDNSVLNVYNKQGQKCSVSDDGTKQNFETLTSEIGYVCGYINNCDECGVSCSGESCNITCDEGCKMKCKTCIYDGESNNFKYRTISLNNVFPNSCTTSCTTGQRKEGYNWDKTASTKAKVTLEEIEETGDKVYETAEYSYTLTPSQMNEIRKYNKAVGTYANSTTPAGRPFNNQIALQCEQTTINGLTYSIRCLSTFLNDTSNTYFTTNKRDTNFTLWTESGYCPSGNCLSREDGIGPSWK